MRDLGLAGLQEFSSYFSIKNTKDNFDYPVDKLPLEFREPFITSGYRRPHLSAREYNQSVFKKSKKTDQCLVTCYYFYSLDFSLDHHI